MTIESLGIKKLEALVYYVHDIERSREFYVNKLDFKEIGTSNDEMTKRGKQKSYVFEAGNCRVVVCSPQGTGGRAERFLKRHPDGIGTVVFEVEDIEKTFRLIDERGGNPITNIQTVEEEGGTFSTFSVTTPFGAATFRFVQRTNYKRPFPGCALFENPRGNNSYGFTHFDHITSNFETMSPALLWMKYVMGFEEYWGIQFHTSDIDPTRETGSGLRSKVMWDAKSGVKFANNEPFRPFFKDSQINIFAEDNRGDGIQHAAIAVYDIIPAVRKMRTVGIQFMPTPGTYYDALPDRIQTTGINEIDEDLSILRELEILIDGKEDRKYLLQIFMQDSAGLYNESDAGPFFYEIIQRKGDRGFGGGNFRALFESIERQHKTEGRI